jgi:hypothetical protein
MGYGAAMPSEPPTPPEPDPAKPKRPPETDELPPLPEDTDLQELELDLDPGEPEPIGQIPIDEVDLLVNATEIVELSAHEPEASDLPDPLDGMAPALSTLHMVEDDLEDFATQEELPILPWSLQAHLLELGESVQALLDPTRATSTWERPDADAAGPVVEVTVRIRMFDFAATLHVEDAPASRIRLGRDVIGGRVLIATD